MDEELEKKRSFNRFEVNLCETHKRIETRGKKGFTDIDQKNGEKPQGSGGHMRSKVNIETNLLFGKPRSIFPIRGCEALREMAKEYDSALTIDPNDADYVPSLFSFKTENAATTTQRINRQNRLKERQENVQRSIAASALLSIASIDDDNSPVSVSVQTDPMMTARSCYPASSQTNIQNSEMEDLLSWKEYALHLEMTNRVQEKYISTLEKQVDLTQTLVQSLQVDICKLKKIVSQLKVENTRCCRNKIFRRVRCIIDCTEIFIERASNNKARYQTYSGYKQHNTVKFLIGISPSGAIIFLSPVWGGRASDKIITLTSGIIDTFVPGDVVLADRGIFIGTELATRGAQLMVPAYTKGKNQLSRQEVETSRVYSNVRIHVERVINRLKDWGVMKGPVPITLVKKANTSAETTVGKMVQVCAALVNLCPPILE
ncbi:uncharacterized protein [Haliotis cracherodii]|uniref:uncharacterized protein n=1 Tax=Haliotis cracherodii TaxID=6455 RepID=UPI0039E9EA8D